MPAWPTSEGGIALSPPVISLSNRWASRTAGVTAGARLPFSGHFLGFSDLLSRHPTRYAVPVFYRLLLTASVKQAVCRGKVEPHVGQDVILRNAFPLGVHPAEHGLAPCIVIVSNRACPPRGFPIIPDDAVALVVPEGEFLLS
jgi:hypothetical protein